MNNYEANISNWLCFVECNTDMHTSRVLQAIPKDAQKYQGEAKAEETIREAYCMHAISLGANDFIENYFVLPICSS
jgi:hypothetical protein